MTNITKQDLRVLSIVTGYLFCDSFEELFEYIKAIIEEPIEPSQLQNRRIQSKAKANIYIFAV